LKIGDLVRYRYSNLPTLGIIVSVHTRCEIDKEVFYDRDCDLFFKVYWICRAIGHNSITVEEPDFLAPISL
jgi:hypothetical protein